MYTSYVLPLTQAVKIMELLQEAIPVDADSGKLVLKEYSANVTTTYSGDRVITHKLFLVKQEHLLAAKTASALGIDSNTVYDTLLKQGYISGSPF